ncbi:MAG: retroviral-like aspartic protease family protein [Euryarchaeota archaeon]|nr:retroviral-like aspartic protease family protein [Euryarchaeota archaeon]
MQIEFSFKREKSGIFGLIPRPVARIILINDKNQVPELVYVDSGADVTLISKSVGELLGFKIEANDKIEEIKGIGERGIPIVIKKVGIKIGGKTIDARVAWSLIEEVPLLLGRVDIFKLFDITFEKEKKTVFAD